MDSNVATKTMSVSCPDDMIITAFLGGKTVIELESGYDMQMCEGRSMCFLRQHNGRILNSTVTDNYGLTCTPTVATGNYYYYVTSLSG